MISDTAKTSLVAGAGFFVGVATYSYFTTTPHHVEWPRAIFIGVFMVLGSWLWNSYKARRASKTPE